MSGEVRRAVVTTASVLVVILVVLGASVAGSAIIDQHNAEPRDDRLEVAIRAATDAVIQSRSNGENLCSTNLKAARAIHALASGQGLSVRQQQRLDEWVASARDCQPIGTTTPTTTAP